MSGDTVYRASDGRFVGDADIWARFESGVWAPCCWDAESGREWVETDDGTLLLLDPVPRDALPEDVEPSREGGGLRVTGD